MDTTDVLVEELIDLAETDRDRFDGAVADYVEHPGDLEPVYRDPALVEATLDALDRLIAAERVQRSSLRQVSRLIAERKACKPLAGEVRHLRVREESRDSPRNRAARRLADAHCAHCGTPLAAQYLRLVREEQDRV